ncbi:hypothetical protein GCM10023210_02470 [Chryseobacterium ginsengisoli]|uniref:Uncharacterized protein n=1 Tax=Chryseobacterium ginsengisoli TaxID=363853 RepID=A0ABP9LUG9_9FLAO
MTLAIFDFTPFKDELPEFNLKLLLNIEDLNNSIFDEVFGILKPHQQTQYIAYKDSERAEKYRKKRNSKLPYVDFNNLPEILDDVLLQKILLYKKYKDLRRVIYDLLSKDQKDQIIQYESEGNELVTNEEIEIISKVFEKKRTERKFMGNMGEPGTVDEYILIYGVDPRTGQPESIENFFKKYTIDPKTGRPVPKGTKLLEKKDWYYYVYEKGSGIQLSVPISKPTSGFDVLYTLNELEKEKYLQIGIKALEDRIEDMNVNFIHYEIIRGDDRVLF